MIKRLSKTVFVVVMLFVGTSCATLHPGVEVETFGKVDPARDKTLSDQAMENKEVPQDVIVTQGEIPEGLDLVDGGSKLVVQAGYENRYEILGVVESDYMISNKGAFWKNFYWTWTDYDEGWRKGLCYWQAPLKLLTLGVWTILVPAAYPCMKSAPKEPSDRSIALIDGLKKGASAMGGNRVVIIGKGDMTIISGNQYGVSTTHVKNTKMRAFIIREAGNTQPTPAAPAEPAPAPAVEESASQEPASQETPEAEGNS